MTCGMESWYFRPNQWAMAQNTVFEIPEGGGGPCRVLVIPAPTADDPVDREDFGDDGMLMGRGLRHGRDLGDTAPKRLVWDQHS